jgi:hypothetical protein
MYHLQVFANSPPQAVPLLYQGGKCFLVILSLTENPVNLHLLVLLFERSCPKLAQLAED